MTTSNASKLPYILAGSAVGGAIALLVTTQSGRRLAQSVCNMDRNDLRNKLDETRSYIERKGRLATDKVDDTLRRAKESIDAGRETYEESSAESRSQMKRLEGKNREIASVVHETVDGISQTVYAFERSILEPFNELGALVKALNRGVREFIGKETTVWADEPPAPFDKPSFPIGRMG